MWLLLQNAFDLDLLGKTINGFLSNKSDKFLDRKFDRLNHTITDFERKKS